MRERHSRPSCFLFVVVVVVVVVVTVVDVSYIVDASLFTCVYLFSSFASIRHLYD